MCWQIAPWQSEDAKRKKQKKRKDETQRVLRIQQLSRLLETVRSGDPTHALFTLAKVYFGLFSDLDRDAASQERLVAHTNQEIAAAALEGFVATLKRSDIPSPKMIGELETEGKEYFIGLPILAGLDVLASKSIEDVLSLPEPALQAALAFHNAVITERERIWINPVIISLPSLAAEALSSYWRPQLVRNLKSIIGLYDLARSDVMKPVAERVSLILLKDNPNVQEDNLELLLHAALRNGNRQELLSFSRHVLAHHSPLTDDNRSLWLAAAFVLDHDSVKSELAGHIRDKSEQAARVLNFLCPSYGVTSELRTH
jgi:hypothetical protein